MAALRERISVDGSGECQDSCRNLESLLPELREAGLEGVEVYRPRVQGERLLRLEASTRRARLLRTGGSDWHGPASLTPLGEFWVTRDEVEDLLERAGH
jgi:predicted metal-dependent phosphoesterase TrpH